MSSPKMPAFDLPLPVVLGGGESVASDAIEREVLALFDGWAPGIRRYLGSFGLAPEVADDLLQDVFVALCRHLQCGRPRTNLKAWLFQVAHNLALKQRRTVLRRSRRETHWDGLATARAIDPSAGPEERLGAARRRAALAAVLAELPDRDRRCLFLRAEGLSYRDISATLRISLGSVAKSLARALATLHAADKEHG